MTRVVGPESNSRFVYRTSGNSLVTAAGASAVVFAAETGATLADILTEAGAAIPGSVLTVDAFSRLPLFQFPDDVSTVFVEVAGGPRSAVYNSTVFDGTGGVGLFSMAHRIWSGEPFSGPASQSLDRGPAFGWALETNSGTSSDHNQYRSLRFTEPGIFSVAVSCSVSAPTADPPTDGSVGVRFAADVTSGFSHDVTAVGSGVAGGSTAIGPSLTFAADADDLFVCRISSNDGGLLAGASVYLTVVKLAPFA